MLSTSQTRSTTETISRVVVDQKYVILKNIYKGKQNNLYLAIKQEESDDIDTYDHQEKYYLIKMKRQTQQNEAIPELQFLIRLKEFNCVPILMTHGEQVIKGFNYHYQIMERHGPSIKLIYNYLSRNIPLPIICLIAIQTLTCLEIVHKHQIVHRNLRPKKLLLSTNGNQILLGDFKYACKFKNYMEHLWQTKVTNQIQTNYFQTNIQVQTNISIKFQLQKMILNPQPTYYLSMLPIPIYSKLRQKIEHLNLKIGEPQIVNYS